MAFVTFLKLSHFRSHRRAALTLDGRPIVVHGQNGAGKTNLIEAVSLLSPGRGLRNAPTEDMFYRPDTIGWKIRADLAGPDINHEVELNVEPAHPRTTRLNGKAATRTALAQHLRLVWLVPSQDRLWIEGAEGRRRFLDRITMSFCPNHAEFVVTYEKAMRNRNKLLKDQVDDPRWYNALEMRMAQAGVAITQNRLLAIDRLTAGQSKAATAFPTAGLTLDSDVAQNADDLAQALAESRPRDRTAGRSLVGPHRADLHAIYIEKNVPARQCSTGEQKALLLSLILANVRALRAETGGAPVVLLDEVAAHLDTDRRAALFDEICALECQAWMTGTEVDLFGPLGPRAQYVEVRQNAGESIVTEHPTP